MYNLSLPELCAALLVDPLSLSHAVILTSLYCAVPYILACVDVSRTIFRDRSFGCDLIRLIRRSVSLSFEKYRNFKVSRN